MSASPGVAPPRADAHPRETECRLVSRVLFVAGELRDDSTGHSIVRLARELRRRGKEVGLVCGGGALVGEVRGIGVAPFVTRALRSPVAPWWVSRKLLSHLREFEPELLHVFGQSLDSWALKLSRLTGLPYVLTVMAFGASARERRIRGDWKRGTVVAVSEELREALVNQARIPKGAIGVIPVGIALEDYERYRDADGSPRTRVVGSVGPLTPDRGHDYFLRAAREILERGHDVHFLLAGYGPESRRLRRLIHRLNIQRWVTTVHHFTDYRRMIAVLDVCVLPALQEGLSLNVIEVMACRKPVVATGVGAVYDVVEDGKTGLLAAKQDPVAIAEKVIQLLEDRDLASRIVEAAYQRVRERFSLQVSVAQLLEFYSKVLARAEDG